MTAPTPQDGEGRDELITDELQQRAEAAYARGVLAAMSDATIPVGRTAMRAALAAVAPDIAAEVRRQCAQELRALAEETGHVGYDSAWTRLADRWSPPDDGTETP